MKDYQDLKELFERFKLEYIEGQNEVGDRKISLVQGAKNVTGYYGLVADFYFDEEGSFLEVDLVDELYGKPATESACKGTAEGCDGLCLQK